MSTGGESVKVIIIALFANLGIALAKFVGAFISGSASMLAEAIHSLVDSTNQVLLLIGNKASKKPPTPSHPLGYGREAFFWSFIVAVMLFSLGGLFAIYEGIHKFHETGTVNSPVLGLCILTFSIVVEGYSCSACIKEVQKQNRFGSLWAWFRKTTSSELLVIFTEDLAAMLGLVIATLALLLAWLTGDVMWDALGSIAVGTLLVAVAVLLAIEIKSMLVGEAPSTDFEDFLRKRWAEISPEGKLLTLIALQVGNNEVMLAYKVSPGSAKDVNQLMTQINTLEKETRANFPEVRWQFAEADDKN